MCKECEKVRQKAQRVLSLLLNGQRGAKKKSSKTEPRDRDRGAFCLRWTGMRPTERRFGRNVGQHKINTTGQEHEWLHLKVCRNNNMGELRDTNTIRTGAGHRGHQSLASLTVVAAPVSRQGHPNRQRELLPPVHILAKSFLRILVWILAKAAPTVYGLKCMQKVDPSIHRYQNAGNVTSQNQTHT